MGFYDFYAVPVLIILMSLPFSFCLFAVVNELNKEKAQFSRFPSALQYVCVINYAHWWVLKNHRHASCLGKQSRASLVSSAWAFKW